MNISNRNFSLFVLSAILLMMVSCKTVPVLTLKKEGLVSRLDPNFSFQGYIGDGKLNLTNNKESLSRFLLIPEDDPEEYVLVMESYYMKGDVDIPSVKPFNNYYVTDYFYKYLNLLLKAQRSFLKREYDKTEKIIADLDSRYGNTYGSIVLAAKVAFVKGDKERSADLFKKAKVIYRDSPQLNAFLAD